MNNKGFMLAEVIIVSAIIVTVLVTMYSSLNKLYIKYDEVSRYYNIDAIYAGKTMSDYLIDNGLMDDVILYGKSSPYQIYNRQIYEHAGLSEENFIKEIIGFVKKINPSYNIDSENITEEQYKELKDLHEYFNKSANRYNYYGFLPIMKKYNVKSMYFISYNSSYDRYYWEIKNTDYTGEVNYIRNYVEYVKNEIKSKYITNNTIQGTSYTGGKNNITSPLLTGNHYPNDYPLGVIITVITSLNKDYYGYVVIQ